MATPFDSSEISRPNIFGGDPGTSPDTTTLGLQSQVGQSSAKDIERMTPGQLSGAKAQVTRNRLNQTITQRAQDSEYRKKQGQLQIQGSATQQRFKLAKQRNTIQQRSAQQRQELSALGRDLDDKLFHQRMEFDYDQMGIRFKHMRQVADFKRMVAKDDEEYADFAQEISQKHTEKMRVLQTAYAKISQALRQAQKSKQARLDHEQKKRLTQAKAALEEKIRKEQAEAKNTMMIVQGAGMAAGAAAGGPAGAMIGAGAASMAYGIGSQVF